MGTPQSGFRPKFLSSRLLGAYKGILIDEDGRSPVSLRGQAGLTCLRAAARMVLIEIEFHFQLTDGCPGPQHIPGFLHAPAKN